MVAVRLRPDGWGQGLHGADINVYKKHKNHTCEITVNTKR